MRSGKTFLKINLALKLAQILAGWLCFFAIYPLLLYPTIISTRSFQRQTKQYIQKYTMFVLIVRIYLKQYMYTFKRLFICGLCCYLKERAMWKRGRGQIAYPSTLYSLSFSLSLFENSDNIVLCMFSSQLKLFIYVARTFFNRALGKINYHYLHFGKKKTTTKVINN